jgi:hypothetical protein
MIVRIHTHPKMSHTIFHDKDTRNVLFHSGVEFVNFPEQADVLIGNRESLIQDFITKFAASKRYLLWTHEPLFWTSAAKWATISGQRVRTMSLHSGDVFLDNFFYASIKLHRVYRSSPPRKTLNRTVAAVSTAKTQGDPEVTRRADGVDLAKLRYELAISMASSGPRASAVPRTDADIGRARNTEFSKATTSTYASRIAWFPTTARRRFGRPFTVAACPSISASRPFIVTSPVIASSITHC